MIIRLLTDADRAASRALWQQTFDDPPAFVDWFFSERFCPEWSAGAFDGDALISVVHGMPMDLSLGSDRFSALMTSGVATVPWERGKGRMHAVMRFLQAYAEKRGVRALFNHPQRPGAYAHLGFQNSTYTKYWQGEGETASGRILPFDEETAFSIYAAISRRYSGFVRRDRAAFHLKMEDYRVDDGRGFLLQVQGRAVGYAVYFDREDVYGEEVLSLGEYGPLLHELQRIAAGRPVGAKLPPDAEAAGEVRPQSVMLAPPSVWQAMEDRGLPCFCVDEY